MRNGIDNVLELGIVIFMRVFIFTREENGSTSVFSPFANRDVAFAMMNRHVGERVKEGGNVIRDIEFPVAEFVEGSKVRVGGSDGVPILVDAPDCIAAVIREAEVVHGDCKTVFRVTQHPVF